MRQLRQMGVGRCDEKRGFCPLPIRNRPGRKYKTRRTKACLQFEEKKEEAQG